MQSFFFSIFVLSSLLLQYIYPLILTILKTHPALPATLKLQVFYYVRLIWGANPCCSGPTCRSTVLLLWWWRDGWLKEINRHGADISQADKWQPQTWKAISGPRREWSPAKPCWFPWVSLLKHRPVPGRNTVVGVSTTSGPFWPLLLPTSMLTWGWFSAINEQTLQRNMKELVHHFTYLSWLRQRSHVSWK